MPISKADLKASLISLYGDDTANDREIDNLLIDQIYVPREVLHVRLGAATSLTLTGSDQAVPFDEQVKPEPNFSLAGTGVVTHTIRDALIQITYHITCSMTAGNNAHALAALFVDGVEIVESRSRQFMSNSTDGHATLVGRHQYVTADAPTSDTIEVRARESGGQIEIPNGQGNMTIERLE